MGSKQTKILTPKEERFVQEYIVDCKAEQAAIRAGYAPTTAHSKAHQWVCQSGTKPHVYEAVQAALAEAAERTKTDADRIREELARIAFHRMSNVLRVDEYGHPVLDYSNAATEDLDNISEISNDTVREKSGEYDEDGKPIYHTVKKVKVKQQDKLAALEKLARMNGLYLKEIEQAAGAFAKTIDDISRRMSRAPIQRDE